MAFYDWDHDGKKDSSDDFIEYQIYRESTNNNNYTPSSGGGISTFGAIVATVGGLFLAAAIVALLGGGEDTPVLITMKVLIDANRTHLPRQEVAFLEGCRKNKGWGSLRRDFYTRFIPEK